MLFKAENKTENGLEILELKNTKNNTRIHILPAAGASWRAWIIQKGKEELNLIDHYENASDLHTNLKDSYKSANLSPFACRIPEGKYTYNGQHYEFMNKDKDGNAIHGLLADKTFQQQEVRQSSEEISASFIYEYRHEDDGYPFDYLCEVTYSLQEADSLMLQTRIKNTSHVTIPIVDGWHPYFTTGTPIDQCFLRFPSGEIVEFDDRLIPTGKFLPYTEFVEEKQLKDITLDNSFLWDEQVAQPTCTFRDPEKKITLEVCPSENYPILQIYTPPHRQSIAIETLSGAPDAFNNGIDLVELKPGQEKTFAVTYKISFY